MFFHFVVKFNVLVDFCESCKKSGVISKVYAFDSACFYCCAQSLKKVHQVFLFAVATWPVTGQGFQNTK